MKSLRLSYQRVEAGQTIAGELAYLPITIRTAHGSVELTGLLDTGSTVNVFALHGWFSPRLFLGVTDHSDCLDRRLSQGAGLWRCRYRKSWGISSSGIGFCLDASSSCAAHFGSSQLFHGV